MRPPKPSIQAQSCFRWIVIHLERSFIHAFFSLRMKLEWTSSETDGQPQLTCNFWSCFWNQWTYQPDAKSCEGSTRIEHPILNQCQVRLQWICQPMWFQNDTSWIRWQFLFSCKNAKHVKLLCLKHATFKMDRLLWRNSENMLWLWLMQGKGLWSSTLRDAASCWAESVRFFYFFFPDFPPNSIPFAWTTAELLPWWLFQTRVHNYSTSRFLRFQFKK